jgi:glycine cleavage system H protein
MTTSKGYHIIPPDENRCVWMTAGVLQYQLCDREFECEQCPLDLAIRHQVRPPAAAVAAKTRRAAPPGTALREGYQYSRNHCWVLEVAPCRFRVGIEPGFAMVLGVPRAIVLPLHGQVVRPGQACAWIVTPGGTLPLEAPAGGSVRTANSLLRESPDLPHRHPFGEGWLYEVAADEGEEEETHLLSAERIAESYTADESRFLTALNGMLRGRQPEGGFTLADVEQRLESILDLVGPTKYFDAVRHVFA